VVLCGLLLRHGLVLYMELGGFVGTDQSNS
jgi:hypothetical protein